MPFTFIHKYGNSVKRKSISTQWKEDVIFGRRFPQDQETSSQNGEEVVIAIRDEINYQNTNQAYVTDEFQEEIIDDDNGREENVKQEKESAKIKLNKRFFCLFGIFCRSPTMNIIFQDLPYLVIRILVIAHRREINYLTSYTIFFAGKNALVILVQCGKMKLHHKFCRFIKKLGTICNKPKESTDLNQA